MWLAFGRAVRVSGSAPNTRIFSGKFILVILKCARVKCFIGQSVAKLIMYFWTMPKSFPTFVCYGVTHTTLGNHYAQELQIQAAYPHVQIAMCLPVAAAVEGSSAFNQIAWCLVRGKYLTDLVHIR